MYKSGIYKPMEGMFTIGSAHIVKIIGWDKDEETGKSYWIVENSFGEKWGENGFIRI